MRISSFTVWTLCVSGVFLYPLCRPDAPNSPFSNTAAAAQSHTQLAAAAALPAVDRNFSSLYLSTPDTLPFMRFDPVFANALMWQESYLRRNSTPEKLGLGFSKKDMLKTVNTLRSMPFYDMETLADHFDFYCLNSGLDCSRVRVTGYYTPMLDARRERTATHQFPLLQKPKGDGEGGASVVSRGGGIAGKPLAWVKSERELANAQLQGSCMIEFPDGEQQFLGFGGSVPFAGGKYVYFTKVDDKVLGAGSFPMTAGYSLAIDPKVAPLGSVIFAELPNLDASGKLIGYTYRIVLAQDRGGAIKSAKKVDLYAGVGQNALASARKINEYGRFWVMLPKH